MDKKESDFTQSGDIAKVRGLDSVGNSIQSTVDQLMDKMRNSTKDKSGLMSKSFWNELGCFSVPLEPTLDANSIHLKAIKGFSVFSTSSATANVPSGYGIIVHLQRLSYGDVGSHLSFQIFCNNVGAMYRRVGLDNVSVGDVTYSQWSQF